MEWLEFEAGSRFAVNSLARFALRHSHAVLHHVIEVLQVD
jgi:uncharacterized protein YaiE (UPF0345 family)